MVVFVAAFALANAYVLARWGRTHYARVFAGSMVLAGFLSLIVSSNIYAAAFGPMTFSSVAIAVAIILAIGLLILVFARPVTYFIFWCYVLGLIVLMAQLLGSQGGPLVAIVAIVAATVVTVLVRKQIILIAIGVFSGSYLASGIWGLIGTLMFSNIAAGSVMVMATSALITYLLITIGCIVAGLLVQFRFYDQVFKN